MSTHHLSFYEILSKYLMLIQRRFVPKSQNGLEKIRYTVKFLNFQMPENFAEIYLKFKQKGQTLGYSAKKMQIE